MSDAVHLQQIRYCWPGQSAPTLEIDEFRVSRGDQVFIQGPSGSGKTTLLSLLGGVIVPEQGTVTVEGTALNRLGNAARDRFRADHIGFVFQQFNLLPYLSLTDNVLLPLRFSSRRRQQVLQKQPGLQEEAGRLLLRLGLDVARLAGRSVNELSVGQQQRVAVARALIGSPEVIVADEPTSALDADSRFAFLDLLFSEVAESGATLLFVSHDPALQSRFARSVRLRELNRAARQEFV